MKKTAKTAICLAIALLATAGAATAEAGAARGGSVLGNAEIDTHNPESVFEFSVHAQGDGRSGRGVVWMSHHNDERIGWMVARVDCVRVEGPVGVVTAVVSDAEDFAVASPGEPIALTVRDNGTKDAISFTSPEQVKRCHGAREPGREITRGDFRVRSRTA
ncbi:hypothetical protein [Amycolatopsis anabasis]|uniref:hypothetical protein n=1 Tax=Amycolatopsis anabasis TaxID=1840409 RepID=UPI00131C68E8|nr:hypothetical protein [Amycolatopsis anabasis]